VPVSALALSDIRDAVLSEQLERIQVDRAAIATRYRMDRSGGHAALRSMLDRLLSEHRAAVAARTTDGPERYWQALDVGLQQSVAAPSSDPHIGAPRRIRALRGAARLDRLSGTIDRVCETLSDLAGDGDTLRVLDLSTGHGDLAVGLARWAAARGVRLSLAVSDDRDGMLDYAAARIKAAGLPARTASVDLSAPSFEKGAYDLICGWGLTARLGTAAGIVHWEATRAARAVLLVEGWRSPERAVLSSLLAARPSGMQEALANVSQALTPQELRLLTAGALGRVTVSSFPPSTVAALWTR